MAEKRSARKRVGLWIVGAGGNVAATTALGLSALRRRLCGTTGMVTCLPLFSTIPLPRAEDIAVGGHEIRPPNLRAAVRQLREQAALFTSEMIEQCAADLRATEKSIRPGTLYAASPAVRRLAEPGFVPRDRSAGAAVERLTADIRAFAQRHNLAQCVVINLSSTEAPFALQPLHRRWAGLERALARPGSTPLPSSSLYAIAAFRAGAAFIDFTPSCGLNPPAIQELAQRLGLPYMGQDGKTGETLLKSAVAPMFAARNLRIRSWSGYNILGASDGMVLDDPKTKASKLRSKDLVPDVVGYPVETRVAIDRVDSLHDRKTAWDFVHFEGFLGTQMSLQLTWQGSDSALAAPLVIDLARLGAWHLARGDAGCLTHLACFFKKPMGTKEHDLSCQMRMLSETIAGAGGAGGR